MTRWRSVGESLLGGEAFHVPNRPFRDMTLLCDQLPDSTSPQTVLQPVDQAGKFLRFGIVPPNRKPGLLVRHILGAQDMKGHGFETEVCFELIVQAKKP